MCEWYDQRRKVFLCIKLSFFTRRFQPCKGSKCWLFTLYSGVIKLATAENIAGSGLNLHLKLVWKRDGEDDLRNIFTAKNSIEKPRVTIDAKLLGNITLKFEQ